MNSDPRPPFLRLSPELRLEIYSYLFTPIPDEDITTINYTLSWPFLDHPSSTTFTAHQVDRCRCPQQVPRNSNIRTKDHIYSRHICQGPEVHFGTRSQPLWLLGTPGSVCNILRPATKGEVAQRPHAGIIRVSRFLYLEALPILYRGRNFLFLTSISSRGRYQAYATQKWLSQRTPFARAQITSISLLCQENEEDCRDLDVSRAYMDLSQFVLDHLPSCRSLCLNVWSMSLPIYPFAILFRRPGMCIFTKTDIAEYDDLSVFWDARLFMQRFGQGPACEDVSIHLQPQLTAKGVEVDLVLEDSRDFRAW